MSDSLKNKVHSGRKGLEREGCFSTGWKNLEQDKENENAEKNIQASSFLEVTSIGEDAGIHFTSFFLPKY